MQEGNENGKDAAIVLWPWRCRYGHIKYNHFLNYDTNTNVWNGFNGNYNEHGDNSGLNWNYHNTTLLYGNMKLLEKYIKEKYADFLFYSYKPSHHVLYGIV